jgi:8-oxo-dGTP pyrophosphatase MutT (NUDIX family)
MAREERSAGFIVFHVSLDEIPGTSYLLLDHGHHWSFPKGHVEPGEDDLAAAIRELREETGINSVEVIAGFRQEILYFFRHRRRGLIRKTVTYFLARTDSPQITLSEEHIAGEFVAFEKAVTQVTFASDREVLRQAHSYLRGCPTPRP